MSELSKRDRGLVTTPAETARYLVSRLMPIPDGASVLDPCAGPGVFPRALLDAGVRTDQITAWDISAEFKEEVELLGVTFEQRDALLSLTPFSYLRFDFVVGNPPYLSKGSEYIRRHRTALGKIYGSVVAHEAYAMFLVNGIRRLREGGRLAFIVSDSFMTLTTHAPLRRYLLANCRIDELTLAPEGLFAGQGVSTSACILVLTKATGRGRAPERDGNMMRVIPRVPSEGAYWRPPFEYRLRQRNYKLLPHNIFFVRADPGILRLFKEGDRLSEHLRGYIGMHTGDNENCIAEIEGAWAGARGRGKTVLPGQVDGVRWKPYLKTGGSERYWRPIFEAVRWDGGARSGYHIPASVPFGSEGVVVSGVSARLAARYMPEGCWWDSNKSIGFVPFSGEISIPYALGLLNSSLYNHLAKELLNRTNCLQLSDLHALPVSAPDRETRIEVERLVLEILDTLRERPGSDVAEEAERVDGLITALHRRRFGIEPGALT